MSSNPRKPSSSNEGFFQTVPTIPNQFYDDVSLQRILKLFLPKHVLHAITGDFAQFGDTVLSTQVLDWVTDAEKNVPYLRGGGRDAFGKRTSELIVTEGWKKLQDYGIEQGVVALGYEAAYAECTRVVQFLKIHLWTGSCGNVTCPTAMTDGAARLLGIHLSSNNLDEKTRRVFQDAYNRVTSRDTKNAWTSGQWMTERTGGSDVSGTETLATFSPSSVEEPESETTLGPWRIDGFKWFSSATDSSMAILLAQTPKGLSTFFAPMYRNRTKKELNGIFIQRLKNKFGTKSLPTAELELSGTRGYLIGKEGQGIQEISTILNITRIYSVVAALGYLGRGLAIAKAFALVREIGAGRGKRLMLKDSPLHMNNLAKITGLNEHGGSSINDLRSSRSIEKLRPESSAEVASLLRVLTSTLKASVCKRSIHALQECMEALGGVGYLENTENEEINIARIYRDCCVLSIWEGTTDVLSSDTLRVSKGRQGEEVLSSLNRWITKALASDSRSNSTLEGWKTSISQTWSALQQKISTGTSETLLPSARDLTFKLAEVITGVLMIIDVESDMDDSARSMCYTFLLEKNIIRSTDTLEEKTWTENLGLNQRIVYGEKAGQSSQKQARL